MTQLEAETLTAIKRAANKIAGIDWEQRRYELVRDILPTIIRVNNNPDSNEDELINIAIKAADKVIEKLKG